MQAKPCDLGLCVHSALDFKDRQQAEAAAADMKAQESRQVSVKLGSACACISFSEVSKVTKALV